jgi:hypothetical protein
MLSKKIIKKGNKMDNSSQPTTPANPNDGMSPMPNDGNMTPPAAGMPQAPSMGGSSMPTTPANPNDGMSPMPNDGNMTPPAPAA